MSIATTAEPLVPIAVLRREFLTDVLTTAVEGGIGYWSEVGTYHWDAVVPSVEVWEVKDDTLPTTDESRYGIVKTVSITDLEQAIRYILSPESRLIRIADAHISDIALAYRSGDSTDLDATTCDIIMQVAVLRDVIYG